MIRPKSAQAVQSVKPLTELSEAVKLNSDKELPEGFSATSLTVYQQAVCHHVPTGIIWQQKAQISFGIPIMAR